MKPTGVNKDSAKDKKFEEELEAEAKKPAAGKNTYVSREYDTPVGQWGDSVNGIDVGNVIRDVLLTLRDHPEIVRKLIADEERNLAEKILSSERKDAATSTDDLVKPVIKIPPRQFQLPSSQLELAPKRVVKKMGSFKDDMMKRQKETPEETIDMTRPFEGGSDEVPGVKLLKDESNKEKQPQRNTEKLVEGGSDQPVNAGITGIKRTQDDEIDDKHAIKQILNQESQQLPSTAQYWKAYKERKYKLNKDRKLGKNYGKQNSVKHRRKYQDENGMEGLNQGPRKQEASQDNREHGSDEVDSPELDNSGRTSSEETRMDDKNEMDLNLLTKQKNKVKM